VLAGNPKPTYTGQSFAPNASEKRLPSRTGSGEGWVSLCTPQTIDALRSPTGRRANTDQSQPAPGKLCRSTAEITKRSDVAGKLSALRRPDQLPSSPSRRRLSGLTEEAEKRASFGAVTGSRRPAPGEKASAPASLRRHRLLLSQPAAPCPVRTPAGSDASRPHPGAGQAPPYP